MSVKDGNKDNNFVSVVVYIRNSQRYLPQFLENIQGVFDENFTKYEILFVDDDSSDRSVSIIKEFYAKKHSTITVNLISLSYYQGVELAMNAGVDISIGDYIFEFDCIIPSFESKSIVDAYLKVLEGNDIVGVAPRTGRVDSKLFYKLLKCGNRNIKDIKTETFRVVSRRAINRIKDMNLNVPYRQIAYATCGLKTATIWYNPVTRGFIKRENINASYRSNLAAESLIAYTDLLYRFSLLISIVVLGLGIKKHKKEKDNLYPLFSVLFLMLGFLIKYIEIIKNLIFKKQNYIVKNVEKIINIQ